MQEHRPDQNSVLADHQWAEISNVLDLHVPVNQRPSPRQLHPDIMREEREKKERMKYQ